MGRRDVVGGGGLPCGTLIRDRGGEDLGVERRDGMSCLDESNVIGLGRAGELGGFGIRDCVAS